MADRLAEGDWEQYQNGGFFSYVGEHMQDWLACLDELEEARVSAAAD